MYCKYDPSYYSKFLDTGNERLDGNLRYLPFMAELEEYAAGQKLQRENLAG